MPMFDFWQQSAIVSLHPQTTQVVLQQETESSNILVGYVSVAVNKPTSLTNLTVYLSGEQQLDWRQGQGPSSHLYSIRHKCIDLQQTLLLEDTSDLGAELVQARVCRMSSDSDELREPLECLTNNDTTCTPDLTLSMQGVLAPGEYRFAFQFALPKKLPASVVSSLGKVEYKLTAVLKRPWLQSNIWADPVPISVVQMPCLTLWPALSGMQQSIGGFASIQALASTPLHLNTQIRNGWKLNVYSASMVLVLGSQTKIQAFVARTDTNSSCDSAGAPVSLEIVEFSASLHEKIVHKVSKSLSTETKDTVSFSTSTSNSSTFASHQRPRGLINDSCVSEKNPHLTTPDTSTDDQWLDIQMIDTLGESLDSLLLPTVASLHLSLPTKPTNDHPTNSGGVQPSSCSAVFSVTHELKINVSVRKVSSANNNNNNNQNTVHRVELVSPVVVLPEAIDDDHCSYAAAVTSALLPCYKEISNDVILAASPSSSTMDLSCLFGRSESHQHALPPAYANTAM